ncbi:DUF916 and DUF3324 domain-containing protein [Enterococcus caccae]|uniref:Uncharacterized protein n=1 Tax=Enterococcus caccae ATCC BAA-1240 TaxID=1158612 RepID=R3UBY4_9ENTE|nr:DUF916 and DUF3324 domain-containing protein [Enterococcus caccae]EOL50918.1 hypothetical protein UC7_00031 [Enterococcus caccae ATCC BAA-1240]EOT59527.1 hypothetical protein I580_02559 [Enterococcus caccae ATCC BAA-1240]OJG23570.1 hypothetical protein RU98_GL001825 [Enterococcus caccae]
MKKQSISILLVLFCLALFFDPIKGLAKQDSTNLIGGLSYEVLYPENQKNKNLGYFDLQMKTGQEQKVSLKLYNSLPKKLTVEVRLNTAKTNSIGKVEYGPNELKEDASLINEFINIVKGPKKVVIPSRGNSQVDLVISLPKDTPQGLIAGGIQLQPVADSQAKEQSKKDVVVNEFAFLVGMLLRVGATDSIKPELKLNKTYIAFKESKSHFFVNISNIRPVYVEGMEVVIQVRKANKQKVLFEYQKKGMRMAPNSMIDLPVDLADKGITAGDYSAQIDVTSKTGGKWSWTEDFNVNALEANGLNKQLVENKTGNKVIFLVCFLILCVGVLVFILSYKAIKR